MTSEREAKILGAIRSAQQQVEQARMLRIGVCSVNVETLRVLLQVIAEQEQDAIRMRTDGHPVRVGTNVR